MCAHATRLGSGLFTHERGYPIRDFEFATIFFTLKIWHHYMHEQNLRIHTDHDSLNYLFSKEESNKRHKHWMDLLRDHNYTNLCHLDRGSTVNNTLIKKERAMLRQLMVFSEKMLEMIQGL